MKRDYGEVAWLRQVRTMRNAAREVTERRIMVYEQSLNWSVSVGTSLLWSHYVKADTLDGVYTYLKGLCHGYWLGWRDKV